MGRLFLSETQLSTTAVIEPLDRDSPKPLYLQIYEELLDLIDSGNLKTGDQFPRELELVERYGVARITVRRAISDLVLEGRLIRRAGKGTFVAAPKIDRYIIDVSSFTTRMGVLGNQARARVLEMRTIPASQRLSRELEVPPESPILELTRLRYSNSELVALETSFLSLVRCPNLDQIDFNKRSLYEVVKSEYGLEPRHATRSLEITRANGWEAQHLNISKSTPLFLLRAKVESDDTPIEYIKTLLRGDRFRFRF